MVLPRCQPRIAGLFRTGDEVGVGWSAVGLRLASQVIGERAPFDVLHDEIRPSLRLARVMDLQNIWVIDGGDRHHFLAEAGDEIRIGPGDQRLDGDMPAELVIAAEIDAPHPTAPKEAENVVPGDPRQRSVGGRRRRRGKGLTRGHAGAVA